ncbi:hypothetical protein D3C86_2024240 [compost metagenome]
MVVIAAIDGDSGDSLKALAKKSVVTPKRLSLKVAQSKPDMAFILSGPPLPTKISSPPSPIISSKPLSPRKTS